MACCKDKKAIFSVRRRPIFSFTKNYATDFQAISRHTAFTSEPSWSHATMLPTRGLDGTNTYCR